MNEMGNKCHSCDFHRQECTFTLSANSPSSGDVQSKKRKLEQPRSRDSESSKRYAGLYGGGVPCGRMCN